MDMAEVWAETIMQRALVRARQDTPDIALAFMLDPSMVEMFRGAAAYGAGALVEVASEHGYELRKIKRSSASSPEEDSSAEGL